SWDDPTLEDHDRPLSKRGRRAAILMAARIASTGAAPDLVLASTALRVRQTLEPIMERAKPRRLVFDREIYLASATGLLEELRRIDEGVATLLLVGHNPALQGLALLLAEAASAKAEAIAGKFPTAALASFDVAGSWRRLGPAGASLVDYVTPRD